MGMGVKGMTKYIIFVSFKVFFLIVTKNNKIVG